MKFLDDAEFCLQLPLTTSNEGNCVANQVYHRSTILNVEHNLGRVDKIFEFRDR